MGKSIAAAILVMATTVTPARAQIYWNWPGSTPQGDYLRGLGVAAYGLGYYELASAQAGSINTDTYMRFNNWMTASAEYAGRVHAERLKAQIEQDRENYKAIRQRLRDNPEALDVDKGDALNVILEDLNSGRIDESSQRHIKIPLSVDEVRRIPFKLGEKGVKTFSMQRLSAKGRDKWPIAFQDRQFDPERKAYERALDSLLEQEYHKAVEKSSLDAIEQRVNELRWKLDHVYAPGDKRYIDARGWIKELSDTVDALKITKIQAAVADLDQYAGESVNDLRVFMRAHNLQFSSAGTPSERVLLPDILEKLRAHKLKLSGDDRPIR